jgi:hypothetical protein
VAVATTKGINGEPLRKTRNGDLDFERDPTKNHTLRALRRISPDVLNIKQMVKSHLIDIQQQATMRERTIRIKKLLERRHITPYSTNENINDLVELLQTMVGAYDKIIMVNETLEDDGMGPLHKDVLEECWLQKRKLTALIGKYSAMVANARNPSDVRISREVDARGQRGSRKALPHEDASEENFDDEEISDPSLAPPNPRASLLSAIKNARDTRAKKFEERGLSRRQKLELIKKERIRAQFPASVLREQESPKRWQGKASSRDKSRLDRATEQAGSRPSLGLLERIHPKRKKLGRRERAQKRILIRETYTGWGGGFQELAREQGRGGSGFVELRP